MHLIVPVIRLVADRIRLSAVLTLTIERPGKCPISLPTVVCRVLLMRMSATQSCGRVLTVVGRLMMKKPGWKSL